MHECVCFIFNKKKWKIVNMSASSWIQPEQSSPDGPTRSSFSQSPPPPGAHEARTGGGTPRTRVIAFSSSCLLPSLSPLPNFPNPLAAAAPDCGDLGGWALAAGDGAWRAGRGSRSPSGQRRVSGGLPLRRSERIPWPTADWSRATTPPVLSTSTSELDL
jgi:hypothetical protein